MEFNEVNIKELSVYLDAAKRHFSEQLAIAEKEFNRDRDSLYFKELIKHWNRRLKELEIFANKVL